MLIDFKILASAAASGMALITYIPYLIDMFRGKNHPHIYTWISIFLVTAVVVYIQFIGGAGWGALPTAIGVIIDGIILAFCFKYGTKDVVFMDKVCLTISIVGVLTYAVFHDLPLLSLAIVTAAEVISFIPTFRKTHNDPYSESLTSYYLIIVKLVLILLALQNYNLLTASYSILWIIIFLIFLSSVYHWRAQLPQKKRKYQD
jgi:hypothetical protein